MSSRLFQFMHSDPRSPLCRPLIKVGVGDKLPPIDLDFGFPAQLVNMATRCSGKKVVIVGLPGAFTPT